MPVNQVCLKSELSCSIQCKLIAVLWMQVIELMIVFLMWITMKAVSGKLLIQCRTEQFDASNRLVSTLKNTITRDSLL